MSSAGKHRCVEIAFPEPQVFNRDDICVKKKETHFNRCSYFSTTFNKEPKNKNIGNQTVPE